MRRSGAVVALSLGMLQAAAVRADEPLVDENLPPVGYTVSVGLASPEEGEIDQRFSQVPRRFGKTTVRSIQLWKEQEWKLHFGETGRMELPTGTELGVRPDGVRGRTLRTKVDVPGVVSTKVRLQNHAPVMVGPVPHGDGYLFIRVEPEFTDHLVAEPAPNPAVQGTVPVNQER